MLCPSCASENPASNGYCGKCGTVLNDAAVVVPHYGERKGLVRREIAVVAGGVCALLVAGGVAWYLLVATRSPTHVVRSFIEADRAGQFTREQEYVANTWDNQMALSLFQSLRKQSGSSPFQNYHILPGGSDKDPAHVNVEITVPPPSVPLLAPLTAPPAANQNVPVNNVKMTVTFVLTRQNDEWKIDSSQTLASVAAALAAQGMQQFQMNPPNFNLPNFNLPNLKMPPGWPNLNVPPALTPAPSGAPNLGPPSAQDGSI